VRTLRCGKALAPSNRMNTRVGREVCWRVCSTGGNVLPDGLSPGCFSVVRASLMLPKRRPVVKYQGILMGKIARPGTHQPGRNGNWGRDFRYGEKTTVMDRPGRAVPGNRPDGNHPVFSSWLCPGDGTLGNCVCATQSPRRRRGRFRAEPIFSRCGMAIREFTRATRESPRGCCHGGAGRGHEWSPKSNANPPAEAGIFAEKDWTARAGSAKIRGG
jgi:hypothetical protein